MRRADVFISVKKAFSKLKNPGLERSPGFFRRYFAVIRSLLDLTQVFQPSMVLMQIMHSLMMPGFCILTLIPVLIEGDLGYRKSGKKNRPEAADKLRWRGAFSRRGGARRDSNRAGGISSIPS